MTVLATFPKQPAEKQDYDIDYSEYLDDLGDTPASVDLVGVSTDDTIVSNMLTVSSISIVGQFVKVWCEHGNDGQRYKVTVMLTTTGGRKKEAEIMIRVKDE